MTHTMPTVRRRARLSLEGGSDMLQPGTRAVPSLRYLHDMPAFARAASLRRRRCRTGRWVHLGNGRAAHASRPGHGTAAGRQRNGQRPMRPMSYDGWPKRRMRRSSLPRSAPIFSRTTDAPLRRPCKHSRPFSRIPRSSIRTPASTMRFLRSEVELTEQEERGSRTIQRSREGAIARAVISGSPGPASHRPSPIMTLPTWACRATRAFLPIGIRAISTWGLCGPCAP